MKPYDSEKETPTQYVARLEAKIEAMKAERLKLDRRIRNQRKAWRSTWEILEMRAGYKRMPEEVRSRMLKAWCARANECNRLKRQLSALRLALAVGSFTSGSFLLLVVFVQHFL